MPDAMIDQLRDQLADGFRDAPVPPTVDEIADDFEVPEVRDLIGKHWSEVPVESLGPMSWNLHWFKRPGIRQYLPAFMLSAAKGEDETAEAVIAYLAGGAGEGGELWPDEKRAVRAWLRYMRDVLQRDDAEKALATYWENPPITPLDEERVALVRRAREIFAMDRTRPESSELAGAVTHVLEQGSGAYQRHLSVVAPYEATRRAPLVHALSIEQLAFVVDFLEYARRRWPDAGEDENLRFWREQLAERARRSASDEYSI